MLRNCLLIVLFCHFPSVAQSSYHADVLKSFEQNLDGLLQAYEVQKIDGQEWLKRIRERRPITLGLQGWEVEMDLQLNNLRSNNAWLVTIEDDGSATPYVAPPSTYRGRVRDFPDSEIRLVITDSLISGTIRLVDDVYFLEPAAKFHGDMGTDMVVVYRDVDVRDHAKARCGMEYQEDLAAKLFGTTDNPNPNAKRLQIAIDTDGEFAQKYPGVKAHAVLEGIVNQLDAIWRDDLQLRPEITALIVRPNPATDPWTDTAYGHGPKRFGPFAGGQDCTTPGDGLWEQFRNYWNSQPPLFERDVMALFVGRDLKICPTATTGENELFGTAGDLGTVCRIPDNAYVLLEEYPLNSVGLLAHELGHSLNGLHVNASSCGSGAGIGPVLCPVVEAGSDYYSSFNIGRIDGFNNLWGTCLEEIYEFSLTADAYTYSYQPTTNFGARNKVRMRTGSSGFTLRSYFKVDVSGVSGNVSSAILRFKTGPVPLTGVRVFFIASSNWDEYKINWNNAPPFSFGLSVGNLPANTWVDIPVTHIVNGNGTFSIGMLAADTPGQYVRSRETNEPPKLIVYSQ